jgi:hypothetical protein
MSRYSARHLVVPAVVLGLMACSDTPTSPPNVAPPIAASSQAASLTAVSRAVAVALGDVAVRQQVRDAMRISPLSYHKLILQEYLAGAGSGIAPRIAAAAGVSIAELNGVLASLPAMDFFVPSRNDRLTWRATSGLLVGSTMDRGHAESVVAYSVSGVERTLSRDTGAPSEAFFLLSPSNSRFIRYNPQPIGAGLTIQDPGDGEEAGSITYTLLDGEQETLQVADILSGRTRIPPLRKMVACDPDCGGGGGGSYGGGTAIDTTYIRAFEIYWDDWYEMGGHEVRWSATLYQNNAYVLHFDYRRDGIEACDFATRQGQCIAWQSNEPGVYLWTDNRLRTNYTNDYIHLAVFEENWQWEEQHGTTDYYFNQNAQWHPVCYPVCDYNTIFHPDAQVLLKWTTHTGT